MQEIGRHISVLAELERVGYAYEYAGEDEIKGKCPFHEDQSPSCQINITKGLFKCHAASCGQGGDIVTFLARILKSDRGTVLYDLAKRYQLEQVKIIEPEVVERYHQALWQAGPLLKELRDRGVTDADIRKYRLGEDKGRVTIPIKNEHGAYINVRRYLPGAPGNKKTLNSRGRGKLRLYPVEQLAYDVIVICGGEIKAIVAARELNPHGIGAITGTAGEENWSPELTREFEGKKVYVCLDVDQAGQKAARDRALNMVGTARWIGVVDLPLDRDKYPAGDINDYVGREKGNLLSVVLATQEWRPEFATPVWGEPDEEEPEELELSRTIAPEYARRRVKFVGMVAAAGRSPYTIPKDVRVKCDRSQECCNTCPVFAVPPDKDGLKATVPRESDAILEIVGCNKNTIPDALKVAFMIPTQCKVVKFETETYYAAENVRMNPSMDITNRDTDRAMLSAICVECPATLNETFEFEGRPYPHPKTQEATLVLGKSSPVSDALDSYQPRRLDELAVFRPSQWTYEALADQLSNIYRDIETNVTRIYQRRPVHLLVDLAYHSPLLILFDGITIKGWVEVLVLGDSSQGKTETATRLMSHYGLGVKVDCKNASTAGLLGGLQKFGDQWMVTWGVIPTNDKRIVILEELKGASITTIARLTDMRSSGIAELPKIEKRRKHARTRLVALSNPRSDRPVSSYGFGIEAVLELIGNPEDVRRFDAATIVSSKDVDPEIINAAQFSRERVKHVYTSELSRELILWAWTRRHDQVKFDEETRVTVLREASRLSDEFTDAVPLVDRGSMRHKLARLSASLAARTFSASDDGHSIIVRTCHVEYVSRFLEEMYSDDTHGYKRLTETIKRTFSMSDIDAVKRAVSSAPFPREFCENLLYSDAIELSDLMDWCGWDRFEAQQTMSVLVRKRALVKHQRSYRKNPDFVALLRSMIDSGDIDKARPAHLPEEQDSTLKERF